MCLFKNNLISLATLIKDIQWIELHSTDYFLAGALV